MAHNCGSSMLIYLWLHIRQHLYAANATSGNSQVNHDGFFLTTDEFASFMFQLKAIEKSFAGEERGGEKQIYKKPMYTKHLLLCLLLL